MFWNGLIYGILFSLLNQIRSEKVLLILEGIKLNASIAISSFGISTSSFVIALISSLSFDKYILIGLICLENTTCV